MWRYIERAHLARSMFETNKIDCTVEELIMRSASGGIASIGISIGISLAYLDTQPVGSSTFSSPSHYLLHKPIVFLYGPLNIN